MRNEGKTDQLQKFLRDLPALAGQNFTSGQFLSGFKSRVMQANDDLAAIATAIKQNTTLKALVSTASHLRLMDLLKQTPEAATVLGRFSPLFLRFSIGNAEIAPFSCILPRNPRRRSLGLLHPAAGGPQTLRSYIQ